MIINLVRHGQASFAADDYDNLSEIGVAQSERLGSFLKEQSENIGVLASGTLRRHQQTARAFQAAYGSQCEIYENANWNEFDHVDLIKQFVTHHTQYKEDVLSKDPQRVLPVLAQAIQWWQATPHDVRYKESWQDFKRRVQSAWRATLDHFQGESRVTVFTSGGPIATSSMLALNGNDTLVVNLNIKLVNTSVSRFHWVNEATQLLSFNEHAHVSGKFSELRSYR